MDTLLVIPCFHEASRLPRFLPALCSSMESLGGVAIRVVEDGSAPGEARATRAVVDSLRPRFPFLLPLLALPRNLCKGGAVYAGWADAPPAADWLAFVDADGSCSASETARLISLARSRSPDAPPPALFASRMKMLGRSVHRQFKRHLLGRIYATLVSELLGIPVYDSQCGLKIIPAAAYQRIASRLVIHGFAFDVDLMTNLLDSGTPVLEIPIDWHEEPGGKVRLLRDSWFMARDVLRIRNLRASP
jgi:dolichyl-phosphate beta-glucosyltransferase